MQDKQCNASTHYTAMLPLSYLTMDHWSLYSGSTNLCGLKHFFFCLFRSITSPFVSKFCFEVHLIFALKKKKLWKSNLNMKHITGNHGWSKNRVVWKLLWIYLKIHLYGKFVRLKFLYTFLYFCCSQSSN